MNRQSKYIKAVTNQNSLKNHFKKNQKSYSMDINMAIYLNLKKLQDKKIFQILAPKQDENFIINFYAFRAIIKDDEKDEFYKLFIRDVDYQLRKNSERKYSIMFFTLHRTVQTHFKFQDKFTKSYQPFTLHYQPKFMQQSQDLYQNLVEYFILALGQNYFIVMQNISKSKSFFSQYHSLTIKILAQSLQHFMQMSPLNYSRHQNSLLIDKKFKLNLKSKINYSSIQLLKKQFTDYRIDHTHNVPLFMTILIETMKQNQIFCQSVGIFRAAGSIQQEQQLISQINEIKTFRILETQSICKNAIAGIIKKMFTNSLTPLIPYSIYDDLINQKIDQKNVNNSIKYLISQLPALNRRIFIYVIKFLREYVIQKKQINKMNAHNISVVFTPCFFRSKQCSLADLTNCGKLAAILKFCLQSDSETWNRYEQMNKSKLVRQYQKNEQTS